MKKIILLASLISPALLVCADLPKPTEAKKPTLSDGQKVEILTAERDLLDVQQRLAPLEALAQQAFVGLQEKQKKISAEVCGEAMQVDLKTLECVAAPPAPGGPHGGGVKPPEVPKGDALNGEKK